MVNFFGAVISGTGWMINVTAWIFNAGWKIWSSLFSAVPYGDPYIAIVAAMMVIYMAYKTIYPSNQSYRSAAR